METALQERKGATMTRRRDKQLPPPRDVEKELKEDEDFFQEGDRDPFVEVGHSALLKELLVTLTKQKAPSQRAQMRIESLIRWFPDGKFEDYIYLCMEFAADSVLGNSGKPKVRRRKKG